MIVVTSTDGRLLLYTFRVLWNVHWTKTIYGAYIAGMAGLIPLLSR